MFSKCVLNWVQLNFLFCNYFSYFRAADFNKTKTNKRKKTRQTTASNSKLQRPKSKNFKKFENQTQTDLFQFFLGPSRNLRRRNHGKTKYLFCNVLFERDSFKLCTSDSFYLLKQKSIFCVSKGFGCLKQDSLLLFNIASGSEANITTPCEMENFNFLQLIWDHCLPLAPTQNDRPP